MFFKIKFRILESEKNMCGANRGVIIKTSIFYIFLQVGLTLLLFYTMFPDKDLEMRIVVSLIYSIPVALVFSMVVFFILTQRHEASSNIHQMANSIF